MQQVNELSVMLNQTFNWNKARIDCFSGMLIGLLKVKSINLAEISMAFPNNVKIESRYRRIQRFIHQHPIDFDTVAWFIMTLFAFIEIDYYLTMDRTNWKWGKNNINIKKGDATLLFQYNTSKKTFLIF